MLPLVPSILVVLSAPVCVVILAEVAVGVKSLCEARRKSVTIFSSGTGHSAPDKKNVTLL